ncbi:hypothetical protein LguiB_005704 [Lonicera macranthoides]
MPPLSYHSSTQGSTHRSSYHSSTLGSTHHSGRHILPPKGIDVLVDTPYSVGSALIPFVTTRSHLSTILSALGSVLDRPQPQDIYPHGFVSGSSRPASQGVTHPGISLAQARLTSEFSWDPKPHIPNASCFAASPVEIADRSVHSISPMINSTFLMLPVLLPLQHICLLNFSYDLTSHSVYTASSPKTQNKKENASSNPLFLHTNTSSTNTVVSCTLTLEDNANQNWDGRPLPQFRIQDKPAFSCKSPGELYFLKFTIARHQN